MRVEPAAGWASWRIAVAPTPATKCRTPELCGKGHHRRPATSPLPPANRPHPRRTPLDAEHDGRNFDIDLIRRPVAHPVVIKHPETGRKALYVNQNFTRRIAGLPPGESHAILHFLYDHCTRERYQARVRYRPGTLAMWDNRCVQHAAVPDFGNQVRELHRVAVLCDERPSR